jgi:hypothetical protein
LIVRRIVVGTICLALISTAAGIVAVSAAFALYALLRDPLTPAGASAAVALAAAALIGLAAFVLSQTIKAPSRPRPRRTSAAGSPGALEPVLNLVKDRPLIAAGAAVAAGLLAVANPALVTAALRAFQPDRTRR